MKRKRVDSVVNNDGGDRLSGFAGENDGNSLQEESDTDSDYDSLFDEDDSGHLSCDPIVELADLDHNVILARRTAPSITGMYFDPAIRIPTDVAERLWKDCTRTYFCNGDVNQVMLFERARSSISSVSDDLANGRAEASSSTSRETRKSALPAFLLDLLATLKELLEDVLPADVHALLFPSGNDSHQARQAILNHYRPGEGITPHVDLLSRYADGIIGVSLGSGTVIDFAKVLDPTQQPALSNGFHDDSLPESYSMYLPERSVFVLTGEARYEWTHGIARRSEDLVEGYDGAPAVWLSRGERLSITFRWLLPGADIVGE